MAKNRFHPYKSQIVSIISDLFFRTSPAILMFIFATSLISCQKKNSEEASSNSNTEQSSSNAPADNPNILPSQTELGVTDSNCMNDNTYDACLFFKNPVVAHGSAFNERFHFGQNFDEQYIGIKMNFAGGQTPAQLKNSSIRLFSSSNNIDLSKQALKISYANDNNHILSHLSVFMWLSHLESEMKKRTGAFFATGKNIPVDVYNEKIQDNAYWDGNQIILGVATNGGKPQHEMALSSEIYLHEMGHANLQFAVSRFLSDKNGGQQPGTCASKIGCISAINEGQADMHALFIFSQNTALGETYANSLNGIKQNGIPRNVSQVRKWTVANFYQLSAGEIHGMGTAYASILWELYRHPDMNPADFEKMFTSHLQKLTESTRFTEARDIFLAEDLAHFQGKYQNLIQSVFTAKGL